MLQPNPETPVALRDIAGADRYARGTLRHGADLRLELRSVPRALHGAAGEHGVRERTALVRAAIVEPAVAALGACEDDPPLADSDELHLIHGEQTRAAQLRGERPRARRRVGMPAPEPRDSISPLTPKRACLVIIVAVVPSGRSVQRHSEPRPKLCTADANYLPHSPSNSERGGANARVFLDPGLAIAAPASGLSSCHNPDARVGHGRHDRGVLAVSYTHLTLPTNREV